jgi:hypothetical protein
MGAQRAHRSVTTVSAVLAAAGVHTLYGSPVSGLPVITTDDLVAPVLARAHLAVHKTFSAAVTSQGLIEIPGGTEEDPESLTLDASSEPARLAARIRSAARRGGVTLRFDTDPGQPSAAGVSSVDPSDPWLGDHSGVLEQIQAAESVVVLAGPGVVTAGAVPGLHALAITLGAGVLNTWGAKGVFHWRSRHHWATIGLQEQDFRLAGIDRADLVLVSGVDEREAPREQWSGRPHIVVSPEVLSSLAESLTARPVVLEMPPLRARLAAATQAGWESAASLLAPSRVTLHYGRQLAGGGLVASDAGGAGFWVARTFGTTQLGMVSVPPEMRPGWAAACVVVARLAAPLRPALAVVEDRIDETTAAVIEFGRSRGIHVGVEIWSPEGGRLDAEEHEKRLRELVLATADGGAATVATDPTQLDVFVDAAGPVVAWAGA